MTESKNNTAHVGHNNTNNCKIVIQSEAQAIYVTSLNNVLLGTP